MNFLRRLFRKKTTCYTYAVTPDEQRAVLAVWAHGGLAGIDEAISEKLVHGGEIYRIRISVEYKVNTTIVKDGLDGTVQKST